jgi:chromosome segregation ATPase
MNDAKWFAGEAERIAQEIGQTATNAESLITNLRSSIQTHADKIVTETTKEREALNKLVRTSDAEINRINSKATLVRDTANESLTSVQNARNIAYSSIPDSQSYANAARHFANFARQYADACEETSRRGDGGDDQRSNNERNDCWEDYNSAIANNNVAQHIINDIAWPKRVSTENWLNDVKGKAVFAQNTLNDIANDIAQSEPIKEVLKSITDYGNDHNFDWLYAEIARITPLKIAAETQLPIDKGELKVFTDMDEAYNKSLLEYLANLKAEKAKGSLADQTSKEIEQLEKELKLCEDKIAEYTETIGLTNGRIAILAQQLVTEQGSLTTNTNLKKTKFDEMTRAEKKYNDLSGQLVQLKKDKSSLEEFITSEELRYTQLKQHIDVLNKNIIQLNIKDYSTKVYNNENLLKLNQTINNDLQKTFYYLNTENINPDLLYTKTKYRQIEKEKLSNIDKLLDILFYCFYFAFIIIRIVTRNTKTEDFLVYILIGLIPFTYPFIYKNSNYIIRLFHLDVNKNAFIEPETEHEISIDAYNI